MTVERFDMRAYVFQDVNPLPVDVAEPEKFPEAAADYAVYGSIRIYEHGDILVGSDVFSGEFWPGGLPPRNTKSVVAVPFAIDPEEIPSRNAVYDEVNERFAEQLVKIWEGEAPATNIADAARLHVFHRRMDGKEGTKAFSLRVNSRLFLLFFFVTKSVDELVEEGITVSPQPYWPFEVVRPYRWGYWNRALATDYQGLYDFVVRKYGIKAARPDSFVSYAFAAALRESNVADFFQDFLSSPPPKVPSVGRRKIMPGQKLNKFQQYLKDNNLKIEDVE
ncbi:hypothetical protein [uncultured Varibaculum sp.]|uniref:hypothetical protein n=1 Tax=uncultured Varibaculum sp. TaxID=413896 RepID=UPI00258F9FC8|nr:hypothetical protein [uncultured Varibaculum sp.]